MHQLLTQQESLEAGQQEIAEWLSSAEVMMNGYVLTGGPQALQQQLEKHRVNIIFTLSLAEYIVKKVIDTFF